MAYSIRAGALRTDLETRVRLEDSNEDALEVKFQNARLGV